MEIMNFNQHYIVLMKYLYAVVPIFSSKILEASPYTVCARSQQTSTNDSLSANLGCDDDMETFSLTNYGVNHSWSLELDNVYTVDWIFLSIGAGTYSIYVELIGSPPVKCMDIRQSEDMKPTPFQQLITCEYRIAAYRKGNRISIPRTQSGITKVFELKPIGLFGINRSVQLNFTESSNGFSKALDNDMDTYYQSPEQVQASWFLKLDRNYVIKWILISTRGGNYEVHIKEDDAITSSSTLCQNFSLHGIKQQNNALECYKEMKGDTILIKRTDDGPLRLFEVYPIICPAGRYGPNCAKCRKECVPCSPITGVCNQCQGPFYGDFCQNQCPTNCLNATCDQTSGTCESCIEGYYGKCCNHEITTVPFKETKVSTRKFNNDEVTTNCDEDTTITDKMVAEQDADREVYSQTVILLTVLVVLILVLVLTVVVLFNKSKRTRKDKTEKENGLLVEFHRVESRNESELEEIPQDESIFVEEEIVTVEYSNLMSQRISIDQFIRELPEKKDNEVLAKEFNDLPIGLLESHSNALRASNRKGNRYKGIYPYDYNRVKLMREDSNDSDDFVNASYINGLNKERSYIAAQGPFTPKTLEDFWTVIWQNDSTRIVMLTNLYEGDRMKCLKYWPDTLLDIGPYVITLDTVDVYDHYVLRYMTVQHQDEEKRVTQFHFTTWPDNSVPDDMTSLICFRNLVRNGLSISDGPVVVHCSAGIGRTGTFISLDYLLEESVMEQTIDVRGYVASLRQQRVGSVQTCEQYTFLHDALVEGLTNMNVRHSCLSVL
ncbi:receptor-type tyrosine-protein phosphatase H-like isoform X2 [Ostrea edulis]|uniref:receptor-type tyrosine-protein phosphatase H-like isoform X2 n=1 Tax=Ostrea edulis TaxID=37623 RepID=UPI0024AF8030|nr:receptor-type tyrosine-protein phosphatase H-like isoform X2 [Ostrea edulis]